MQYSAVFVKKHLLESLVNKIKVLKLLTYKHKVKEETILKTAERLCPNYVTPAFKDFLGLKKQKSQSPPKIGKNLVLTSRVKLIEETIKDNDEDIMGKTLEFPHPQGLKITPNVIFDFNFGIFHYFLYN